MQKKVKIRKWHYKNKSLVDWDHIQDLPFLINIQFIVNPKKKFAEAQV
jgi:adenylate cyclase class IV